MSAAAAQKKRKKRTQKVKGRLEHTAKSYFFSPQNSCPRGIPKKKRIFTTVTVQRRFRLNDDPININLKFSQ